VREPGNSSSGNSYPGRQSAPQGGNNGQPPARVNNAPAPNNTNPPQASRDGFHSFQPPVHNNGNANANQGPQNNGANNVTNNPPANDNNRGANNGSNPPSQNNDRSSMKFTPPVQAKDGMYDVHPPLNQKQGQAPPKQEEKKPQKANKKDQSDDKNKH
jgi:hypothetical protein